MKKNANANTSNSRGAETTPSVPGVLAGQKRREREENDTSNEPLSKRHGGGMMVVVQRNSGFTSKEHKDIQAQACRAIISANLPHGVFEDREMQKLMTMLRDRAMEVLPSGKVVGGRLLYEGAKAVDQRLKELFNKKEIGLSYVY